MNSFGNTITLVVQDAFEILLIGLLLGAGLPTLFAVGVRGLAIGNGHESADGTVHRPNPVGNVVAGSAFLIVVAATLVGLMIIVAPGFGKAVDFSSIIPTLKDK